MKKILALLLSVCLIFSLGITAFAAGGDIVILHTNDVHTHIDNAGITYATVAQMKKDLDAILVDAGDHLQGTAYGAMDNGATIVDLMNAAGYDVATLGNHEFDYGMARALEVTGTESDYTYVSCNFTDLVTNTTVLDSYKIIEKSGVKVAFVGITTPETFTKSAPAYFQDGSGNWIYGITGAGETTANDLYNTVQTAIDAAKAAGADYVIALGHLGVDETSAPWRSTDVIANTTGLDAFIDGHSHTTVSANTMIKDKNNDNVLLSQTGDYLSSVGKITIKADGTIANELITEYTGKDEATETIATAWATEVDGKLGVVIAETDINFTISGENDKRQIRVDETNLGDLSPDAYYYYINMKENLDCDVAIMNGGGIRATIPAGEWSYNSAKTVHPFGNVLCLMEVPGQVILDALEWGAKSTNFTPGSNENGGFLHVAGLTYDVDIHTPSTVQIDGAGLWSGAPTGDYRVKNVKVFNRDNGQYEDLDLSKTYRLAGTNYTLRACGDGFNMFGDAVLVKDYIAEDYLALSAYLMAFDDSDDDDIANIATANSPLKAYDGYVMNYEDLYEGAERIGDATDYNYDTENHWLECACGEKGEAEPHDLEFIVDVKPQGGFDGLGHYECNECDYVSRSEVIPFTDTLPRPSIDNIPGKADNEANPNTGAPVFGVVALVTLAGLVMRRK